MTSTIVLASGFAVLTQSLFLPMSEQGGLICIILVTALILDFFLLPPLLMALDRRNYCVDSDENKVEIQQELAA